MISRGLIKARKVWGNLPRASIALSTVKIIINIKIIASGLEKRHFMFLQFYEGQTRQDFFFFDQKTLQKCRYMYVYVKAREYPFGTVSFFFFFFFSECYANHLHLGGYFCLQ